MEQFQPDIEQKVNDLKNIEKLGYEAISEVAHRYGSGYEDDTAQPEVKDLAYHNMQHSWRVSESAAKLAQAHVLTQYDIQLVRMIAAAHDVIHESDAEKSAEELSADWLLSRMEKVGLSAEDQEIARLAIMGTTPMFDTDGEYMGQHFMLSGYPSVRAGEIALCVAAADMEAVFASYGPSVSHDLFKERIGLAIKQAPNELSKLIDFQVAQIKFIQNFQPLYPELEQFYGGLRHEIIEHHAGILRDLLSNKITSWQEVVKRDAEFHIKWSA